MLVQGHVAGQERQGIGVACRLDLHIGDFTHQIVARAHAQIAPIIGNDEAVRQVMAVCIDDNLAQLLQAGVPVGDDRFVVHESRAGFLSI